MMNDGSKTRTTEGGKSKPLTLLADTMRTACSSGVSSHGGKHSAPTAQKRICAKCVLPETIPGISFDENGVCDRCRAFKRFVPYNHDILLKAIDRAKRRNARYHALVPLSGGKDSAYVLYLARSEYNLRVLSYTFDNGFLTPVARRNIRALADSLDTDHVFFSPSWNLLQKLYHNSLLLSGDICGVCGIGMAGGYRHIAAAYGIPLILLGTSPMEADTVAAENIYDTNRFRAIIRDAGCVKPEDVERFILSEPGHPLVDGMKMWLFKTMPLLLHPLYYREHKTEEEVRSLLLAKTCWQDPPGEVETKHFDCLAEPFTNFMRMRRNGFSRRHCQYSTLIRLGEMSRVEALRKLAEQRLEEEPPTTTEVLKRIGLSRDELELALNADARVYANYCRRHGGMWLKQLCKSLLLRKS